MFVPGRSLGARRLDCRELEAAGPAVYLVICCIRSWSLLAGGLVAGQCRACGRVAAVNQFTGGKKNLVCCSSGKAGTVAKVVCFSLQVNLSSN